MFDMNFRITTIRDGKKIVTKTTILPLIGISIEKSVQNLADFATISLSGFSFNRKLNLESLFKGGDRIKIELGYDDQLINEFEGYIDATPYNENTFLIKCIDELYTFKKPVPDKAFKDVQLTDLLQYVSKAVSSEIKVVTDVSMKYDSFIIHDASGFDVLKKIAEDTKFNIYFLGDKKELHVHGAFIEKFGDVTYSMQENVEEFDLTYITKNEKRLKVIIEGTETSGKAYRLEKGDSTDNKEIIKMHLSGVNVDEAKKLLETTFTNRFRDRYEGSLTTWLIPYCAPGYTAKILDEDFPEQKSSFYVDAVTTEFSDTGGKRNVKIGFRVG